MVPTVLAVGQILAAEADNSGNVRAASRAALTLFSGNVGSQPVPQRALSDTLTRFVGAATSPTVLYVLILVLLVLILAPLAALTEHLQALALHSER